VKATQFKASSGRLVLQGNQRRVALTQLNISFNKALNLSICEVQTLLVVVYLINRSDVPGLGGLEVWAFN